MTAITFEQRVLADIADENRDPSTVQLDDYEISFLASVTLYDDEYVIACEYAVNDERDAPLHLYRKTDDSVECLATESGVNAFVSLTARAFDDAQRRYFDVEFTPTYYSSLPAETLVALRDSFARKPSMI